MQSCVASLLVCEVDAGAVETLPHSHDVLAVSFRPDGKAVACSTLDGCIHIWNPLDGEIMVRHSDVKMVV